MHTDKNKKLAEGLVDAAYVRQGIDALNARHNLVTSLLSQRRMPENGWDDASIEYLLSQLALMDSNNFTGNVGVGEREARVYSDLVKRRTFNLGHGIGRSGDVSAVQPKAAGSSTIVKLATGMMLGLIKPTSGAVFINGDEITENGVKENLKIVDLTGAGDLFAAGFLHGFINNLSSKECLDKGTDMSSKVIQQIGARL